MNKIRGFHPGGCTPPAPGPCPLWVLRSRVCSQGRSCWGSCGDAVCCLISQRVFGHNDLNVGLEGRLRAAGAEGEVSLNLGQPLLTLQEEE